jgi:hypothetical protein
VPDILAGAGLDVAMHTLFLAPTMKKTEPRVLLPLYFPSFWATVELLRQSPTSGTITLKVVKQFGPATVLKQITAHPIGVATANGTTFALQQPFKCTVKHPPTLLRALSYHVSVIALLPRTPRGGDVRD